jgi:hypothetical protein
MAEAAGGGGGVDGEVVGKKEMESNGRQDAETGLTAIEAEAGEVAAAAVEKGEEEAESRPQMFGIKAQKSDDWMHMTVLSLWQRMHDDAVASS